MLSFETAADVQVGLGACEGGQVVGEHVTVQGSGHACYSIAAGSSAKLQDCVAAGAHPLYLENLLCPFVSCICFCVSS